MTERKLAAILSADVVGYSRLMADDEAATVETLQNYRASVSRVIDRHKGRIVNAPGDNVLAEFASAVEAVQAAVEIQKAIEGRNVELPEDRRMQFRVGVNLGDVIQEDDGTIYGDGVNIAARMEALAETGGICIASTVYDAVEGKLDFGFDFLGEQPVKNIAKPVRVYRVRGEAGSEPAARARATPDKPPSRLRRVLLASAAIVLLLGLGLWAAWPRLLGLGLDLAGVIPSDTPALPDKPSLVVLPFQNMSDDPEQEYFSDGITEDLTNALAGNPNLFVIARNSAFTYKGRAVKVEDVGRELGVRYVLEGSVRKAAGEVRITAQLIDAETGFHSWSRQYDRRLDDVFAVQSEISEEILGAVGAQISDAELARIRRKPTQDIDAYETMMRGYAIFTHYRLAEVEEARALFRRATEMDPQFAQAWAMLGASYSAAYALGFTFDPDARRLATEYAQRAIDIDPTNPNGHTALASISMSQPDRIEVGLVHADRAISLAPSFPIPHLFRARALSGLGRPAEALTSLRRALRLDPRIEANAAMMLLRARLLADTGRQAEGVELLEKALAGNPDLLAARLALFESYAADRPEDARALIDELQASRDDVTRERLVAFMRRTPGVDDGRAARLDAQLRTAGLE